MWLPIVRSRRYDYLKVMPWPGASNNVSVSFACKCRRLRAELENAAIPIAVNLAAIDGKRSRSTGQNEGASAARAELRRHIFQGLAAVVIAGGGTPRGKVTFSFSASCCCYCRRCSSLRAWRCETLACRPSACTCRMRPCCFLQ